MGNLYQNSLILNCINEKINSASRRGQRGTLVPHNNYKKEAKKKIVKNVKKLRGGRKVK